jgi:chemotaxis protein MotB
MGSGRGVALPSGDQFLPFAVSSRDVRRANMRRLGIAVPALLLSILAVGCASTDWESRYLEKEAESRALQEQMESQNQYFAERQAASEALREDMTKARAQIETLAGEISELQNQPPVVQEAPVDQDYEALRREYERLKAKYDEVRITEDGNLEIILDSNVTFASGSHRLTAEGRRIIDSLAGELKHNFAGNLVEVIGHTDSDPIKKSPYKDNWELGSERALEVTRYLSANHGIDSDRLKASSRGATMPIADNATKEGKRKNRRVEVVVVIPKRDLDPGHGSVR